MTLTLIVALAVLADWWLGELPAEYHPLVGFGRWATRVESRLLNENHSSNRQKLAGIVAALCTLAPCLLWLFMLPQLTVLQAVLGVATLYFCIGANSLRQHVLAVARALSADDLPLARQQVGKIVSRQTDGMSAVDVRRAAIESALENGADAVFAPLFWFVVLGPFGALLYRFSNTLDAMWGYKTPRYRHFGWAAARLDDVLNWIPARLTALSYALLGNVSQACRAWREQAHLLDSPNGGPVMTTGAGALNLQLGGPACYHGQLKDKPWFGGGECPQDGDIRRACGLVDSTLWLWMILIALGESLA